MYIRKEFNSLKVVLVHQHGRPFIVLEHQYDRWDAKWKRSIGKGTEGNRTLWSAAFEWFTVEYPRSVFTLNFSIRPLQLTPSEQLPLIATWGMQQKMQRLSSKLIGCIIHSIE